MKSPFKSFVQFSDWGPATIAGGSGLLGAGLGIIGQAIANRQNLQNWQMQNFYNRNVWQMENIYNSPRNQVARLQEAGINPNLITGGYSSSSNAPKADNVASANPMNFGAFATAAAEAINQFWHSREMRIREKVADAQVELMEEQKNYYKNSGFLALYRGMNQQQDFEGKKDIGYWDLYRRHMDQKIENLAGKNLLQDLEYSFNQAAFTNRLRYISLKNTLTQSNIDYLRKLGLLTDARTTLTNTEKDLVEQKIITVSALNEWNASTREERKQLLKAYLQIAQANAKYADKQQYAKLLQQYEDIVMRPVEDILKLVPNFGSWLSTIFGGKQPDKGYSTTFSTDY